MRTKEASRGRGEVRRLDLGRISAPATKTAEAETEDTATHTILEQDLQGSSRAKPQPLDSELPTHDSRSSASTKLVEQPSRSRSLPNSHHETKLCTTNLSPTQQQPLILRNAARGDAHRVNCS
ncbi:hypothetical protein Droror1_Dr00006642 [Drosera rotundifolia]